MLFVKICPKCNNKFQVERKWNGKEYYKIKKERRYCSLKCGNSRIQTKEMNEARSKKLKKYPDNYCKICGKKISYKYIYCIKHCRSLKDITYYIDDNGCYICDSHVCGSNGASSININGKSIDIYRYLWIKKNGYILKGFELRHKCDNRKCINLDHLELGTHKDNMTDMVKRDRSLRGERHSNVKLTEQQVIEILNDDVTSIKKLSEKYNISRRNIYNIKNKRSWIYLNLKI